MEGQGVSQVATPLAYTIREAVEGEAVRISELINSAFAESDNWYKKEENQMRVPPDGSAHSHPLTPPLAVRPRSFGKSVDSHRMHM